jgi:hypothetical protein
MRTRTARLTILAAAAAAATLAVCQVALATTATGHQDPHLKVVSTLAPTKVHVAGTLHATVTVTNTSSTSRKISISWEYDTPNSGMGTVMSPITIKPNATWTHKFSKTAPEAGKYKLIIQASEGKGGASKTSKATSTASAG